MIQSNILIRDDGTACLADYDLFQIIGDAQLTSTNIAGAARWTAPEIFNSDEAKLVNLPYTAKSDVYSFAMTIIEVRGARVARRRGYQPPLQRLSIPEQKMRN